MFRGRTGDAQPLYLLYFVPCVRDHKQMQSGNSSRRGRNQGVAAEAEAVGEQQLTW